MSTTAQYTEQQNTLLKVDQDLSALYSSATEQFALYNKGEFGEKTEDGKKVPKTQIEARIEIAVKQELYNEHLARFNDDCTSFCVKYGKYIQSIIYCVSSQHTGVPDYKTPPPPVTKEETEGSSAPGDASLPTASHQTSPTRKSLTRLPPLPPSTSNPKSQQSHSDRKRAQSPESVEDNESAAPLDDEMPQDVWHKLKAEPFDQDWLEAAYKKHSRYAVIYEHLLNERSTYDKPPPGDARSYHDARLWSEYALHQGVAAVTQLKLQELFPEKPTSTNKAARVRKSPPEEETPDSPGKRTRGSKRVKGKSSK
jgi:hypothetical protein